MHHTFPDLQLTIKNIMAADDQVGGRYMMRGTQYGELMEAPSTGKAVEFRVWYWRSSRKAK